jgi:large subunit ribosomal protein L19
MNAQLIGKIQEAFAQPLNDAELRASLRVGDTIVAYTKILVNKKIQKSLTTAEKQALKKAASSNKEEVINTQPFKGVIIAKKGWGSNVKIVVRKMGADNVGVEKIIPLYSTVLEKVELLTKGKPRRAKLYYLRSRVGKKALRVKEK